MLQWASATLTSWSRASLARTGLCVGIALAVLSASATRAQQPDRTRQQPPTAPSQPVPLQTPAQAQRACLDAKDEDLPAKAAAVNSACTTAIPVLAGDDLARAHARRAFVRYQLNDIAGAIADWTRRIELTPNDVHAHFDRGTVLARSGDRAGAIRDLSRAIELAPQNAAPYLNRARLYREQGDYARAIADYGAVLRNDARNIDALYGRAVALHGNSRSEDAIRGFTDALAVDQRHLPSLTARGVARLAVREYDGAIADLNAAIGINPALSEPHFYLGKAYQAQGKRDLALSSFTSAANAFPFDSDGQVARDAARKALDELRHPSHPAATSPPVAAAAGTAPASTTVVAASPGAVAADKPSAAVPELAVATPQPPPKTQTAVTAPAEAKTPAALPAVGGAPVEAKPSRFCQVYADWSSHVYRYTGLDPRRVVCR